MGSKSASDFAVMDFSSQQRFVDGQVLLIDKPFEWTSFDVVNKLRWALRNRLGVKKFKVGHAGTLDPLATGVLVICTGRATKAIASLQSDAKSYTATIRLGATTPCLDAELPVSEWVDAQHIDKQAVVAAATQQTGTIDQMPPLYSAKKIKGQKAYAVARKGGDIELKASPHRNLSGLTSARLKPAPSTATRWWTSRLKSTVRKAPTSAPSLGTSARHWKSAGTWSACEERGAAPTASTRASH